MAKNPRLDLTSVNIYDDLNENFKIDCISSKFSLQKLVNRCIHLYLSDPDFKKKILGYNTLVPSGSL